MQRADPDRAPCARKPRAGRQVGAGTDRGFRLIEAAGPILGAVLAGGQSRRFGRDKALALLDGQPLIDHAIAALAPFAATTLVCGRQTPGALPDLPRVGLGPLGGLAAALDHAERHGFGAVLTIGCDMPRVPATLLAALIAAAPAYCPDAPILGCWPVSLADELLAWLATFEAGERGPSLRAWAERAKATPVPAPAPLPNINTPADLARL